MNIAGAKHLLSSRMLLSKWLQMLRPSIDGTSMVHRWYVDRPRVDGALIGDPAIDNVSIRDDLNRGR